MQYFVQYLKSLFFNFLTVFFANHILSGIDVSNPTKLPHVGGDMIFAFALGILNASIFPILKLTRHHLSAAAIAVVSILLNFTAYALIKFLPAGIEISSIEGYFFGSLMVSLGSFLTNYVEMKHFQHPHTPSKPEHKHDHKADQQ